MSMTEQEAINTLEAMKKQFLGEARDVLDMAIMALEKQIPKKPNKIERKRDEYGFIYQLGECPLCGKMVTDDRQCCDCGQLLDWTEV